MPLLEDAQIRQALPTVPDWSQFDSTIARTFLFKKFPEAVAFVDQVALEAEQANHHPDIDIRYNKVTLTLSTHSEGGLTEKDFALAVRCDDLYAQA